MAEGFPTDQPDKTLLNREKREENREKDFNKAARIKETLMKLEKSVISEVDEGTQAASAAIHAMGFSATQMFANDDEDDDLDAQAA